MAAHIDLGRWGEDLAAAWYVQRGYRVLDRNWRTTIGEIDLVVRTGRVVVFAEVKTRRSAAFGVPGLAVGRTKQLRLRRLAARWLAEGGGGRGHHDVRFDVVSIAGGTVDVYHNAF